MESSSDDKGPHVSATYCSRCGAPGGLGGRVCANCGSLASPFSPYGGQSRQLGHDFGSRPMRTMIGFGVAMLALLAFLFVLGSQRFG